MVSDNDVYQLKDDEAVDEIRDGLVQNYPNVYGTALGFAIVDGKQSNEPCIFAYVDQKEDEPDNPLPREIDGIRVDVRERNRDEIVDEAISEGSNINVERVRPAVGGAYITGFETGSYIPCYDTNDNPALLTAHHIVENDSGGVVTNVYQPVEDTNQADNNLIGTVTDYGADTNKDYAVVTHDDTANYSGAIIGADVIDTITDTPSFEKRVVVFNGFNTIAAGRLISIDVTSSGRFDFEYDLDGNLLTSGSSGGIVAQPNDDGSMTGFGLHNSSTSTYKNAAALTEIQNKSGISFPSVSADYPSSPSWGLGASFVAAAIRIHPVHLTMDVRVVNAGDSTATKTVSTEDADGDVIDQKDVTLDPFEWKTIKLDFDNYPHCELNYTDGKRGVDMTPYFNDTHPGWENDQVIYTESSQSEVNTIEISPNDNYLAIGMDGKIDIIDLSDNSNVTSFSTVGYQSYSRERTLAWSPDGTMLAASMITSTSGYLKVYDTSDSNPANWVESQSFEHSNVRAIEFSPDNNYIALTMATSPYIRIYNTSDWTYTDKDIGVGVDSCAFDPKKDYLTVTTFEQMMWFEYGTWNQHPDNYSSNTFSSNIISATTTASGKWIVNILYGSTDGIVVWNARDDFNYVLTKEDVTTNLYAISSSHDGEYVAICTYAEEVIYVYRVGSWELIDTVSLTDISSSDTSTIVFENNSNTIYTANEVGEVCKVLETPSLTSPTNLNVGEQ